MCWLWPIALGIATMNFRHTRSGLDNNWVRHIMSPSSALSSPKKGTWTALACSCSDGREWQTTHARDGKGQDSWRWILVMHPQIYVEARAETKWRMKLYNEALQLPKPTSQSCPCRHTCTLAFDLLWICVLLLLQVFPVFCKIVIIDINCACSSVLEKEWVRFTASVH